MKYYTLCMYEHGKWRPEFGDYERDTVKAELDDFRDHGVKAKDLRIIVTDDTSAGVEDGVAKLNTPRA